MTDISRLEVSVPSRDQDTRRGVGQRAGALPKLSADIVFTCFDAGIGLPRSPPALSRETLGASDTFEPRLE